MRFLGGAVCACGRKKTSPLGEESLLKGDTTSQTS